MSYKSIAIFGCKSTTKFLIKEVLDLFPISIIVTINPFLAAKNDVADYCDLKKFALSIGVPIYEAKSYSLSHKDDVEFIKSKEIDIAFVVGWQRLIPEHILSHFKVGAFGMHGSAMDLPQGRGRSPMNWSIIEDRRIFYTNLFRYDPGVDSGDIIDTLKFQITPHDTAETMHFKNTLAMQYLIKKNLEDLLNNTIKPRKQNSQVTPTYYPKRSPSDSLIDWSQDVYQLDRFIRAVTKPFNGSFSYIDNNKIIIWRAQVFDVHDFGLEGALEGTVISKFDNGKFIIKCFAGLLLVHEYESEIIIEKDMRFSNNDKEIKYFDRNHLGYFDLH